jgi:hypothetical protein
MSANIDELLSRFQSLKETKNGWSARCPAHDDDRSSLSVGVGDDGRALLHCHAGCTTDAICAAVGLQTSDLFPAASNGKAAKPKIVKVYEYRDENKHLLFQVCRTDPKGFCQRQPGNGSWKWSLDGVRRVLYRLPELMAEPNRPLLILEGEKDVDNAREKLGVLATCNPGGADRWRDGYSESVGVREVLIIPDNDPAGRKHAEAVARSLWGKAKSIRIVELLGLPPKGDLSDWIAAGGTKEKLLALALATPRWQPIVAGVEDGALEPPKYKPFPTDLLPEPVASLVHAASKAMGCDESYVALPIMAAMAAAVGNSRRIQLKRSWCEPCVIWAVIVGESGTLKSPAMDAALAPLRRLQAEAWREFQKQYEQHERETQIYDADYAAWKTKGRKNGEPAPIKPAEPVCQRLIAEDTTVEALAVLLQNQPRGLLIARDEVSGWLNSFDAYKSARGADVAHWLTMHRAGSCLVDRKTGRKTIRVPRAAVSVTGGVQPRTFAAALAGRYQQCDPDNGEKAPPREHFENGLAARLLLAMPPRVPKRWTDADIDQSTQDAIDALFDRLAALPMLQDEHDEPGPLDVPATAEAKRLFIEFYNENAVEQCELESDLAAAWSKIEGYAARFALLFWLIRRAAGDPTLSDTLAVDAKSMAAGIELARWFADEAARVYATFGGCQDSPGARYGREERRLISWIRRQGGRVTARDLTRGPRRFRGDDGAKRADGALDALVHAGVGTWEHVAGTVEGGRPTRVFVLSDAGHETTVFQAATTGDGDETPKNGGNGAVSSPSPPEVDSEAEEGEWSA